MTFNRCTKRVREYRTRVIFTAYIKHSNEGKIILFTGFNSSRSFSCSSRCFYHAFKNNFRYFFDLSMHCFQSILFPLVNCFPRTLKHHYYHYHYRYRYHYCYCYCCRFYYYYLKLSSRKHQLRLGLETWSNHAFWLLKREVTRKIRQVLKSKHFSIITIKTHVNMCLSSAWPEVQMLIKRWIFCLFQGDVDSG